MTKREWKGRDFHHLRDQICLFTFTLILVYLDREEVYAFDILFLKMGIFNFPDCRLSPRQTTEADPGFPRLGGANPEGGVQIFYWSKISRKLHENERIWTQRVVSLAPPLRSANGSSTFLLRGSFTLSLGGPPFSERGILGAKANSSKKEKFTVACWAEQMKMTFVQIVPTSSMVCKLPSLGIPCRRAKFT